MYEDPPEDPDEDLDSLSGYTPDDTGRYRLRTSVMYAGDYNDILPFQCKGLLQDTTGHFSLHEFNVWASTEADAHEKGIECAQRIIKANHLTEAGATVKITYFD
jgi:hypothetical protein